MASVTSTNPTGERLLTKPFVSVSAGALIFFMYIGMVLVVIPRFIEDELGYGEFGVGVAVASFAVAAISMRPFLGRLTERFGRRAVMMTGALSAGAAGAVSGLVGSLWELLILRGVMGIGESAVFVAAATLVADLAPPHRRAEAASYFSVAVYGGIGIGPSIGEWVLADDRYAVTFGVAGLLAVLATVPMIGVPSRVKHVEDPSLGKVPLFHRAALWPGVVMACGVAAFSVYTAFIPDHARQVGLAGSAGLFLVYSITSVTLRIVGAKLPERLGERTMVTVAMVSLAAALGLIGVVAEPWALWVGALLMGVGMAFMYPSLMANVVNRVSDRDRATAMSSFTMFFELGTIAGGLVLGAVGQAFSKQAGFLGGALISLIGLVVLWRFVTAVPADALGFVGVAATEPSHDSTH